ncbi:MAG: cytidylate kinase-like family protein [Bacillota bacterium]|nr:cytidylate kinase-like family protein [Bacillota bacterium]
MNQIITIGRQFGSGGRIIAKELAERLDIKYYDKELITVAAKESGISPEVFEKVDEEAANSLLYSMVIGMYTSASRMMNYSDVSINDKIFRIQTETIEKIAVEGPCVIVGRCADYILRDNPHCIKVFIYSDVESRVNRAVNEYKIESKNMKEFILRCDKKRANYYNFYTGKKWGATCNYNICLDSGAIGIDGCVDILKTLADNWKA